MIAINEYLNHEIVGSMTTVFGDDFHLMPTYSLLGLSSVIANFQLYYDAGANDFTEEAISDVLPDWINPDEDLQTKKDILISSELCYHLTRIEQEMNPCDQLKLLNGITYNLVIKESLDTELSECKESILDAIENLSFLQKQQALAVLTNCQNYYYQEFVDDLDDIFILATQDVVPGLADEDPELMDLMEFFDNKYSEEEQLIVITIIAQSLIEEQDGVIQEMRADFLENFLFTHESFREGHKQLFINMADNGRFDRFLMNTPREQWEVKESEPKARRYYNYSF